MFKDFKTLPFDCYRLVNLEEDEQYQQILGCDQQATTVQTKHNLAWLLADVEQSLQLLESCLKDKPASPLTYCLAGKRLMSQGKEKGHHLRDSLRALTNPIIFRVRGFSAPMTPNQHEPCWISNFYTAKL